MLLEFQALVFGGDVGQIAGGGMAARTRPCPVEVGFAGLGATGLEVRNIDTFAAAFFATQPGFFEYAGKRPSLSDLLLKG